MTPRRIIGAAAAILLSGGAHLAGSGLFTPDRIELDGGGEPVPARLGTSFADMVAGMPGSVQPDVTEPVEPEAVPDRPVEAELEVPTEIDATERAEPEDVAEPAEIERADAPRPGETAVFEPSEAHPTQADPVAPATLEAVDVPALTARPSTVAVVPATPVETTPVEPTAADAIVETEAQVLTPLSSPRPSRRPEGLAPPPQPQVAASRPQPQQPAATGNGPTNTTRGEATGTETGEATASAPGPQQPTAEPGNAAAVANYPGQVMRQISRQGRPRLRHTGPDAVIAFRIAANGGLAGLSVARSSGNPELDQAGLSIVQRAAPFPPPPGGAQTSFSVAFGGR
ncbi:TonB family protein [Rhodobacterales bacterium HKCCE4037]|nr:TonB family protein [Rhodobacterales bacterium HKCCE4037]